VSFAFIGGAWMAHSNLTRFTKAADQVMMGLNLVLLLFVSFLPFTTSLLANHLDDNGAHIALVIVDISPRAGHWPPRQRSLRHLPELPPRGQ
jgi:uncharacterized membrane protein